MRSEGGERNAHDAIQPAGREAVLIESVSRVVSVRVEHAETRGVGRGTAPSMADLAMCVTLAHSPATLLAAPYRGDTNLACHESQR